MLLLTVLLELETISILSYLQVEIFGPRGPRRLA